MGGAGGFFGIVPASFRKWPANGVCLQPFLLWRRAFLYAKIGLHGADTNKVHITSVQEPFRTNSVAFSGPRVPLFLLQIVQIFLPVPVFLITGCRAAREQGLVIQLV